MTKEKLERIKIIDNRIMELLDELKKSKIKNSEETRKAFFTEMKLLNMAKHTLLMEIK